ncbi:ABC transporter ATP-binding protein [uncultured Dialister sp.]|uniref:ABC transporter ATP-binding protein n=1 Tax=uncultured Dialister sp. TaxID=278064 RepID=UPI0025CF2948|nr:ATP-binding cassette domain-containing protein [uncultured Dialister sp.]
MDILEIRNVTKTFRTRTFWGKKKEVHALNGVSLTLKKGESLGIVGESGCGKSTLANLIIHLIEPTSGQIFLYGKDISHAKEAEVRELRKKVQIVFQDPYSSLSPRMKIGDILMEPARVMKEFTEKERRERAEMLLEIVGLRKSVMDRYPHEFSGGQRQRISIARALMTRPDILILDEPTSALDVSVQAQVLNLLMDLRGRMNLTYLFISHNLAVVRYISDRTAVMQRGSLVEIGDSDQILTHPSDPYTKELIAAVPMIGKPFKEPEHLMELGGLDG